MAGVLKKKAVSRYDVSMLSQEVPDEVTAFILKLSKKNQTISKMTTLHQSTGKYDVMIATVKIIKIFRFGCKIKIVIKLTNF